MFIPDGGDWAKTTWRGDESEEGLGEGKLTLTVDPKSGAADGPRGPARPGQGTAVTGEFVHANVARKDVTDNGFTGTLEAKLGADSIEGTIRVSTAEARVIREASFQLKKATE